MMREISYMILFERFKRYNESFMARVFKFFRSFVDFSIVFVSITVRIGRHKVDGVVKSMCAREK